MAEVLAVGASVVTILGLVKACVNIYDEISQATRPGADLDQIEAALSIEKLRFFLWCQDARLIDGVVLLDAASSSSQVDPMALWKAVSPQIQPEFVLGELKRIMQSFVRTMKESQSLIRKYFTTKPPSSLAQIISRINNGSRSSALVANVYLDGLQSNVAERKSMSTREKWNWSRKDKKDLKALVELLRNYNDGLLNVLSMAQKIRHGRQIELLATTSPVESVILAAQGPSQPQSLSNNAGQRGLLPASAGSELDIYQLINLRRRSAMIEYSASELQSSTTNGVAAEGPAARTLFASSIRLGADEQVRRNRMFTLYENRPVVLEWRYYSQRLKSEVLSHLRRRVDLLSAQLSQSSQTTGFSTLNSVGHYEDETHNRIAIVFAYPNGKEASKPVTLKQQLAQGQTDHLIPDHDQRLSTAAALALTFYRLHSVGWLHKSLRSDNVLFFNSPGQDPHLLSQPYVCGFDFSRQDSPNELTENIPSVLLQQYNDMENKIYRHPDLDLHVTDTKDLDNSDARQKASAMAEKAAKDFRYKKSYDIYSLGILLLEIGHWCPAMQLSKGQTKIADFRKRISSKYLPELRYRMGKKYHDVVEMCLNGNFDNPVDKGSGSAANGAIQGHRNSLEVDELRERREWLENFERHAVRVLEELAAAAG